MDCFLTDSTFRICVLKDEWVSGRWKLQSHWNGASPARGRAYTRAGGRVAGRVSKPYPMGFFVDGRLSPDISRAKRGVVQESLSGEIVVVVCVFHVSFELCWFLTAVERERERERNSVGHVVARQSPRCGIRGRRPREPGMVGKHRARRGPCLFSARCYAQGTVVQHKRGRVRVIFRCPARGFTGDLGIPFGRHN